MEEAFNMLRKEAVDIAESPIEYQTGSDPRFAAVTLPFLLKSQMANVEFLRLIDKSLFNQIIAEKFNAMPLAVFVSGVHDYGSSKKLVKTMADWKGLLVWVANSVEAQTVEALNAATVSLPFFEGIPSMQKGVVDSAVGVNPSGIWNFKWYDTIKYITIANMFGTSGYFYV